MSKCQTPSPATKRSIDDSYSPVRQGADYGSRVRSVLGEQSGNIVRQDTPTKTNNHLDAGAQEWGENINEEGIVTEATYDKVSSATRNAVSKTTVHFVTSTQKASPVSLPPISTTSAAVPLGDRDDIVSKHNYKAHSISPTISLGVPEFLAAVQAKGHAAAAASTAFPRRPFQRPSALRGTPTLGKVYYMPDGRSLPCSIIHSQQRNAGFFNHPVIVTGIEGEIAYFYALTRAPPQAIGQLRMCLRIGTTSTDEGAGVLKLARNSSPMKKETWVNLERRFSIEWKNLELWAGDVCVHSNELWKLWKRVTELEADQNRYIYKPLPRNMAVLPPGTVVLLANEAGASTLGAPVLILENLYPQFRFLRVKVFEENFYFHPETKRKHVQPRHLCLEISSQPKMGHDDTPVMLLEPQSPAMRQPSYVEVFGQAKLGNLDECKTWCWPPVLIRQQSMIILRDYMASVASLKTAALSPSLPVDVHMLTRQVSACASMPSPPGWHASFTLMAPEFQCGIAHSTYPLSNSQYPHSRAPSYPLLAPPCSYSPFAPPYTPTECQMAVPRSQCRYPVLPLKNLPPALEQGRCAFSDQHILFSQQDPWHRHF